MKRITILRNALSTNLTNSHDEQSNSHIISSVGFKELIRKGALWKLLWRYEEANIITYDINTLPRPFMGALLLRILSRGSCWLEDESGRRKEVTSIVLLQLLSRFTLDCVKKPFFLNGLRSNLHQTMVLRHASNSLNFSLDLNHSPVYLRTDLCFGLSSGGSVGHIAGVINNLDEFAGKPIFITTDIIPTVRTDIETHIVKPTENNFWSLREIPFFSFNYDFYNNAVSYITNRNISFIYQRYCLDNFCGVRIALDLNVPFILEYNGSEIWTNRYWGEPLKYDQLAEKIELSNLQAATIIVVVSKALKNELIARGIDPEKILVNPNGVEPDRYSPDVDGSEIRNLYGLQHKTVIGFIGTFGKWHGAEVLAEAFGLLLQEFPELKDSVRLLMIGDGVTMPQVRQTLSKYDVTQTCILTGLVAQAEGPKYLAACDILASPHVPNPDGTPFFGSPTKLFEYMAMGKGIVASNLEQIGEVLNHDQTAWLVEPGNAASLMGGLQVLIEDEAKRMRLGQAARQEVVKNYSWKEHTRKIIEKLKERCSTGS